MHFPTTSSSPPLIHRDGNDVLPITRDGGDAASFGAVGRGSPARSARSDERQYRFQFAPVLRVGLAVRRLRGAEAHCPRTLFG